MHATPRRWRLSNIGQCQPLWRRSGSSWGSPHVTANLFKHWQTIDQSYQKYVRFRWDKDCQRASQIINDKLVSASVLSYPMWDEGYFVLDTIDFAMGAVLSQMQQGDERVIAYASKTLSKKQQHYSSIKKELLPGVHFVEQFRQYLYGRHFVIRTDHSSLKWLRNFKNIDGMLARWSAALDCYGYTMLHGKGNNHRNTDGMQRIPPRKCPR